MAKILKKVQLSTEQSISQSADSTKGTQSNPYTQEEMAQLQAQETWQGGYVEAMGMVPAMTDGMGASSGSGSICIMCLLDEILDEIGFGNFERKCLMHFLDCSGSELQLTNAEWEMVKKAIPGEVNHTGTQSVNLYGNQDLNWALGTVEITFNKKGEPIALKDTYNFNPEEWGERELLAEFVTRLMHIVEILGGGKSYSVTYKVHSN